MTIFYEGTLVKWTGSDVDAEGHIVALAMGEEAAHVKWASGPDKNHMTFVDLFDIEPVTAAAKEDPFHLVAVREAYDEDQEIGVLNFLASNKYLDSWKKIASDVLAYTADQIRRDASMDLVEEQLSVPEREAVIHTAALALLKDAFGPEE